MIKIFTIALPLLASSPLYSQNLQEAVNSTMKVNNTVPVGVGVIDMSCIQCDANTEVKSADEIFCSNLFSASCLNPDGSRNEDNSNELEKNKLKLKLKEAQNLAATTLGYKDHNEALYLEIKKLGFELPESLTEKNYKKLRKDFSKGEYGEEINFPAKERCEKVENTSLGLSAPGTNDNEKLIKKIEMFKEAKLQYAHLDIPNFLSKEYEKCDSLKNPSKYPHFLNIELADKCKKFPRIREKAVELYRMEESPEYKKLAQEFVRDNLLPSIRVVETDEKSELYSQGASACYGLNDLYNQLAANAVENYEKMINRSRPVVQEMIKTYYDANTKIEMDKQFAIAKKEVKKLLPRITKDSNKIKIISKDYDEMELTWIKIPEDKRFIKDKSGLDILIESSQEDEDDLDYAFGNSKLSFFTTINAFYYSFLMEGDKRVQNDKVTMMPFFLNTLKTNKYNFLAVLSHEVGHKIGPQISKENGHDLRAEWSKLLDCYRKTDSIKMIDKQRDEVIADYISSEVLANILAELPISERKNAFKMAMKDFCLFNDCDNVERNFGHDHTHPDNIFRINGILGANPKLKKAIGCPAENPKYRSCTL